MNVQITWDNDDKTIFRYDFNDGWTWDEFFTAKQQANRLMDAVPHKFGVIIAAPRLAQLPPDTLTNSRKALRTAHPNTVMLVMVISNPLIRTVVSTLRDMARVTPMPIAVVSTLDEGRARLHKRLRDYAVPPSPAN